MTTVERTAHFLDPASLDALAQTAKSFMPVVAHELKRRIPLLFNELSEANEEREFSAKRINGFFHIINCDTQSVKNLEPLEELFVLVKPMFHITEEHPALGVQAAELLLNRCAYGIIYQNGQYNHLKHWDVIKDLYTEIVVPSRYNVNDPLKCTYLNRTIAAKLGKMCQLALPQDPEHEFSDVCQSLTASLRAKQYPQTLEDMRAAAKALNQIQYYAMYPIDLTRGVLLSLQNGCTFHEGDAMHEPIIMTPSITRSIEEKGQDFDRLRALYLHVKHDLALEIFGGAAIGPYSWNNFLPALLNDKQAEFFKKRDLERHFK